MKKIVFYLSVIVAVAILLELIGMLILTKNFTEFKYGVLVGRLVLLALFSAVAYFLWKKENQKKV